MKNYIKILFAVLAFSVYITSFSIGVSAASLLGDVNGDAKISASDARIVLRAAASLEKLSSNQQTAADYDKNGKVNAADARYILRVSAKLDPFAKAETFSDRKFVSDTGTLFSTGYAKSAVLYDYDNDVILYDKNMHRRCHPASTTKLITACLASEYLDENYVLKVGSELNLMEWNTSKAGIYQGQRIKFKEILKCLLVPSGCDAAYTIAVNTARVASGDSSMSAPKALNYFISMMNDYAKKLGMNDSHFANPDGFPNSNHYVSAYDMMIIGAKAYSIPLIRNTVNQPWATAYFESGGSASYTNSDEIINPYSSRYYPYAVGIKTGSHSLAGICLVSAAKKYIDKTGKEKTFIAVVMGCPSKYGRYADLKSLYDTGFSYFWR